MIFELSTGVGSHWHFSARFKGDFFDGWIGGWVAVRFGPQPYPITAEENVIRKYSFIRYGRIYQKLISINLLI